jgi:hypothetical protein
MERDVRGMKLTLRLEKHKSEVRKQCWGFFEVVAKGMK